MDKYVLTIKRSEKLALSLLLIRVMSDSPKNSKVRKNKRFAANFIRYYSLRSILLYSFCSTFIPYFQL